MIPIYRFFLRINGSAASQVYPVYKDDLSLNYELYSGQQFHRAKLSGKLTFIADDYTTILAAPYDATFYVDIESSTDRGATWGAYYSGKFYITDCTINYDDKTLQTELGYSDRYAEVLDGWEREFNLVKLAPALSPIVMHKRPMLQFYTLGNDKVTNVLRGLSWEVDAVGDTSETSLVNDYHFSLNTCIKEVHISECGETSANDTYAGFINYTSATTFDARLYNYARTYYIRLAQTTTAGLTILLAILYRVSNNTAICAVTNVAAPDRDTDEFEFDMTGSSGMTAHAELFSYIIYARIVCDVDKINGQATQEIPANDIVADNRNYNRCKGYGDSVIRFSNESSIYPTEWGIKPNGEYYVPAPLLPSPVAVFQSRWRYASLWYDYDLFPQSLDKDGTAEFSLRDASPIASVISVLLQQIAPNITHQATEDYSEFLYAQVNPVSGDAFELFLTQKSNVLAGNYTQAAQMAKITLKIVLDALKNIYKCYWFIDSANRLRIEHISWFMNGGSYLSDERVIGLDYTLAEVVRSGKKWAFATSEVTFDKEAMPERYEFSWMDDVTEIFDGQPIIVDSPRVQQNKKEEVQVASVTTDVDYMLLSPNECSKDGFAMLACIPSDGIVGDGAARGNNGHCLPKLELAGDFGGRSATLVITATGGGIGQVYFFSQDNVRQSQRVTPTFNADGLEHNVSVSIPLEAYYVVYFANGVVNVTSSSLVIAGVYTCPFVTITNGTSTISAQNGLLAFNDLQPKYLLYDMPALGLTVNGQAAVARSVSRTKRQTISAPVGDTDPNATELVRTFIGDGDIMTMQINLQSRTAKFTLAHGQQ